MIEPINTVSRLFVKQVFEFGELLGFESRNKYRICDEQGRDVAFAAEQQKSFIGMILRQIVGHWRTFEIHFFDNQRQKFLTAHHPFRWYFQCLEISDPQGQRVGTVERRFAILSKRFEVRNAQNMLLLEVSSPFWRIWTFPFHRQGREMAKVAKKWSGFGSELFTDRDNFLIEFSDSSLHPHERGLILAAAIYIDLMFFEKKGRGGFVDLFD